MTRTHTHTGLKHVLKVHMQLELKEHLHFFCSFFFFLLGLLSSVPSSSSIGLFIGGAYAVLGGICTETQQPKLCNEIIQIILNTY